MTLQVVHAKKNCKTSLTNKKVHDMCGNIILTSNGCWPLFFAQGQFEAMTKNFFQKINLKVVAAFHDMGILLITKIHQNTQLYSVRAFQNASTVDIANVSPTSKVYCAINVVKVHLGCKNQILWDVLNVGAQELQMIVA